MMGEFFLRLVNISIAGGWMVLAVMVIRLLLSKSPKWITCLLWGLAGLRFVIPFSFKSAFSLVPSTNTFPIESIYSAEDLVANNSYYHAVDSGIGLLDNALNPLTYDVSTPDVLRSNISIISYIWVIGLAVMLLYAVVSYINIYLRVRESTKLYNNVWLCDRVDTPFIFGIIKPRIILPSSMSDEDREYVIAHERAHLKRLDHLTKPFGFLILSLHWFNPLAWVAYILFCRDIEFACDQKVLRGRGDEIKKPYSNALINCSVARRIVAACPLAFGETGVKSRIKRILSYKKPTVWIIAAALILCAAVAVCFLTNPLDNKGENKNPASDVSNEASNNSSSDLSGGDVSDSVSSSNQGGEEENVNESFNATVVENHEGWVLVEPFEDEWERRSSNLIEVPQNVVSTQPVPELKVGSKIRIVYNGEILESYPAQLGKVFAIYLLEEPSTNSSSESSVTTNKTVERIYTFYTASKSDYVTSKTYEDDEACRKLSGYLSGEHLISKTEENWAKFNPSRPNERIMAVDFDDNTTMIFHIYFGNESSGYYLSAATAKGEFDLAADYSTLKYDRFVASSQLGQFILTIF